MRLWTRLPGSRPAVKIDGKTDRMREMLSRCQESPAFHVEDTTLNVVPSSSGNMLTALSEGGLQCRAQCRGFGASFRPLAFGGCGAPR